jgi:hypothetical protein
LYDWIKYLFFQSISLTEPVGNYTQDPQDQMHNPFFQISPFIPALILQKPNLI